MTDIQRRKWASILERMGRAFIGGVVVQLTASGIGVAGVDDFSIVKKAAIAGGLAVLSLLQSLVGTNLGDPNTPSLLTTKLDPAAVVADPLADGLAAAENRLHQIAGAHADSLDESVEDGVARLEAAAVQVAPLADAAVEAALASVDGLKDWVVATAAKNGLDPATYIAKRMAQQAHIKL